MKTRTYILDITSAGLSSRRTEATADKGLSTTGSKQMVSSPSEPSEAGTWTSTVVAGIFQRPGPPTSTRRASFIPHPTSSLSNTTLQLPIRQLDNKAKVNEWLGGVKDVNRPSEIFTKYAKKKVTFADDTDNEDKISEATIRPAKSEAKAALSKVISSFVSDADYPTVVEDSSDDDERQACVGKVLIQAKARDWVWRAHHGPSNPPQPWWVKQKTNLMIIERHWGGDVETIIPSDLKPRAWCPTLPGGGAPLYQNPMQWEKGMVVNLRKISARCSLRDFITEMRWHIEVGPERGFRLMGMTPDLVAAFCASLKNQVSPRTLEDVASDGPNVGEEGELGAGSKTARFFHPAVPQRSK